MANHFDTSHHKTKQEQNEPKKAALSIQEQNEPKKAALSIQEQNEPKNEALSIQEQTEPKNAVRSIYEFIEEMILAVIIVVVVFAFFFRVVTVIGTSMEPNFYEGDKLIISSTAYEIKQGDVVVIVDVLDKPIIKRVIALSGQTVDINSETGTVFVDGEALDESLYTQNGITKALGNDKISFPCTVPENSIFVLGDNRVISKDSRYSEVGMIDRTDLLGKVEVQIYPFSEFKIIK